MSQYRRPVVAFDVDGTLIGENDAPREEIISILRLLVPWCTVIVWSGCGTDYARMTGLRLGLPPEVHYRPKGWPADITFDDAEVNLGTVNVKVGEHGNDNDAE